MEWTPIETCKPDQGHKSEMLFGCAGTENNKTMEETIYMYNTSSIPIHNEFFTKQMYECCTQANRINLVPFVVWAGGDSCI